jgi:hypothetical protein
MGLMDDWRRNALSLDSAIKSLSYLPDPFRVKPGVEVSVSQAFALEASSRAAHAVEQGGVGFSDREPIGTEHVGNCVAVVIRDAVSGKVGLAHYDALSDPISLNLLLDNMPQGSFHAVLIGAMYGLEASTNNDYLCRTSVSNLRDVMSFLMEKDIPIVSARLHDPAQPTNFVVDPKTFVFSDRSPTVFNQDKPLAFCGKFLGNGRQPLNLEFDFTRSPERYAYHLGRQQIDNLKSLRGESTENIARWFRDRGACGGFEYVQTGFVQDHYLPALDQGRFDISDSTHSQGITTPAFEKTKKYQVI